MRERRNEGGAGDEAKMKDRECNIRVAMKP